MADGRKTQAVAVNYGTFTTARKLRNELDRMLDDNHGKDISLEPPISATGNTARVHDSFQSSWNQESQRSKSKSSRRQCPLSREVAVVSTGLLFYGKPT